MYVADLVRLAPGRRNVARASLSRTLRRLWRAGWVELISDYGYSLTAQHADADASLLAAQRDPDGTYARAAAAGGFFLFATPEEYLAYLRRNAAVLKRGRPMHIIQITSAGRGRLTSGQQEVNRTPKLRDKDGLPAPRPVTAPKPPTTVVTETPEAPTLAVRARESLE